MSLENSITCQFSKGSICLLLAINIHCPKTKYREHPPTNDVEKQLIIAFDVFEKLLTGNFVIDLPPTNFLIFTQ